MRYFDPTYGPIDTEGAAPPISSQDISDWWNVRSDPRNAPRSTMGDIALPPATPRTPVIVPTGAVPMPAPAPQAPPRMPEQPSGFQLPGTLIGRPTGMDMPVVSDAPAPPGLAYSVDRSRGSSGADWLREHQPAPAPTYATPRDMSGILFSGDHTQADLEGRANMRRMLDAAYGPTSDGFDPLKARIEDAEGRAALALAERRAADPIGFARMQAMLPEEAKLSARLSAGTSLAGTLGGFEDRLAAIDARRLAFRATPQYQAATPQARQAAEDAEGFDADEARIRAHMRTLQQAMGFATGNAPSSLYAMNQFAPQ